LLIETSVVVAESFSQAAAERDDALRHVDELNKKLEVLEKESQDALDQAKTKAQEREKKRWSNAAAREGGLEGRVSAFAEKLSSDILSQNFLGKNIGLRKLKFVRSFLWCTRGTPGPHEPSPTSTP
jgi:hypothetical protein